ncbi:MAG: tyrosine-type recombinase/integrase [Bacteriovoracaceae bacterium]
METIKTKTGLRYREMIWVDGKQYKSPTFKKITDCRKWKIEFHSKKNESHFLIAKTKQRTSFKSIAEDWFISKTSTGISSSTAINYRAYLDKQIYPSIGEIEIKSLTRQHIEKIQKDLIKCHNPKGVNLIMSVLKSVLKYAVEEEFILKNPALRVKKVPETEGSNIFWTQDDINQFQSSNHGTTICDITLVALNTGMRKGELAGLKWDKVDLINNRISVSRTRDRYGLRESTKTKLIRHIPMNPMVRNVLIRLSRFKHSSGFVFISSQSFIPVNAHHIYRDFRLAQKRAGIMNLIRFHDLRHTFASQFMMNGGAIYDLQKILGHTDIKMTQRYAHLSPDHLRQSMNSFCLGENSESNEFQDEAYPYPTHGQVVSI